MFSNLTFSDKGVVALVAQEESYSLTISVSFKNSMSIRRLSLHSVVRAASLNPSDPTSQSDFTYSLEPVPLSEIDPGHTCLSVPDPPSDFAAGANATIQLKYTADAGQIEKETFYACADITYVAAASLDLSAVPCFNATEDEPASTTSSAPTQAGATTSPSASATTSAATQASSGAGQKKSGATLSKGGIAGAVIGSAVGSLAIVGLGILFYRERQKTRRLERQRDSAGAVGWRADHTGKDSASGGSYRMDSVAT